MRRPDIEARLYSVVGLMGMLTFGFAAGVGVSYRIAWRWLYRPRPM